MFSGACVGGALFGKHDGNEPLEIAETKGFLHVGVEGKPGFFLAAPVTRPSAVACPATIRNSGSDN